MTTAIHRAVDSARRGELPSLIARMPSGWLVLGEAQILRGYSLLLPDPVVPHLNALSSAPRSQFLADMARAGDALLEVTGAVRINYEMLGNLEPALHAHLVPRYADEPDSSRTKPVWLHDWAAAPRFNLGRDAALAAQIATALARLVAGGNVRKLRLPSQPHRLRALPRMRVCTARSPI